MFQVCSDLHLEFHRKVTLEHFVHPSAKNLIVAGDLSNPHINANYVSFVKQASEKFEKVFLVSGNHECYDSTLHYTRELIQELVKDMSNVYFLDNSSYEFEHDNIVLLGTPLWSYIVPEEEYKATLCLNDYHKILNVEPVGMGIGEPANIVPKDINKEFQRNKTWLISQIEKYSALNKRIIIVTHHMPSYRLIEAKYQNSGINSAFASDLESLMCPPITHWIFGHTHTHIEATINNVQCIANPFGYPQEANVGYKSKLVFS